jgi:hypothetical protein
MTEEEQDKALQKIDDAFLSDAQLIRKNEGNYEMGLLISGKGFGQIIYKDGKRFVKFTNGDVERFEI